jgi:uncharacterized alpha-E superfamily protein
LNVQLYLMLERGAGSDERHWERVRRSLGVEVEPEAPQELASSIVDCITLARENARQVREQISSEMWEQLNRLFHAVKRADPAGDARDFLRAIQDGAHSFQGITDSTMTHGEGWQFIQAGRYLERAIALSTLVSVHFREFYREAEAEAEVEPLEWIGLLQSCTAFEAYCKAYTADLRPGRIAEFLVLNAVFPHSIRFSADALAASLKQIGREGRPGAQVERIAGRMQSTLEFGQMDEIMSAGLQGYLDTVRRQCVQVYSAVYQTYVSYPVEAALGG